MVATLVTFGINSLWGSLRSGVVTLGVRYFLGPKNNIKYWKSFYLCYMGCATEIPTYLIQQFSDKKREQWLTNEKEFICLVLCFCLLSLVYRPNGRISQCRGNRILLWLRGGQLNSGPVHMYPYWFENAIFFLCFRKNSRPLGAFSHRLRPSTRLRWSIWERQLTRLRLLDPYVLKDKKGKRPSATSNKFLILRGVD